MKIVSKYVPHILLALYVIGFVVLGFRPYDRLVWYAENIPTFMYVLFFVITYIRGARLSNLAYVLAAILPICHMVGGYYTFELVPFDWFNHLFVFEGNMFNKVCHFTAAFSAYALTEYVIRYKKGNILFWAMFLGICFIGIFAMTYEIIGLQYAILRGGNIGVSFLDSQGDIWGIQKDMLVDTLPSILFGIGIFAVKRCCLGKK